MSIVWQIINWRSFLARTIFTQGLTEKVGLSMQLRSGTLLPNRRPQFFFHLICSTAILQPDLALYGALSPAWQRSSASAGTRPHNTSKDTQITVQEVSHCLSASLCGALPGNIWETRLPTVYLQMGWKAEEGKVENSRRPRGTTNGVL